MNRTEERLTEALRDVGDTLGPHDVPAPDFQRGRAFTRRPALAMAGAALAITAVVAGSAALTGGNAPGRETSLAPPDDRNMRVTVFLCAKTSVKRACGNKEVTEAEKREVERLLKASKSVRRAEYEDRREAYERFRKRIEESGSFVSDLHPGDIPPSFLVEVRDIEAARETMDLLNGRPGVDQVVVNGSRVIALLCTKDSAVPKCGGKAATSAQIRAFDRALRKLPNVIRTEDGDPDLAPKREIPGRNRSLVRLEAFSRHVIVLPGSDAARVVAVAAAQPGVADAFTQER